MEQILTMSQSAAAILVAVPVGEAARKYLAVPIPIKNFMIGFFFFLVGALLMFNPVLSIDGIRADSRGALVAIVAAFYGPVSVIVAALGMAIIRFVLGGAGALPGILSILAIAVTSLILWHRTSRTNVEITFWHMVPLAALAAAIPAMIAILAPGMTWSLWLTAISAFAPASFVAVLLTGTLLMRDRERDLALAERNETQAQLDSIARNAPTILFEIDLDDEDRPRFRYVSDATTEMLNLAPDTLKANFGALEAMLPVTSRNAIRSLIRQSAEAESSWTFETEATLPDRRMVWLQIAAHSRRNATGRLVWDGTIADVTEQRKLDRMKDDFIAVVSHELKTPVTAIRGSLGLIASAAVGEPNPRVAQLVTVAERNSERLMLLVNDILEMQQLRTEQLRLDIAAHAIRPLLEATVEAAREVAAKKEIEVILDDDVPDAAIDVDAERLQQILANLLSNAIKFSPAGSAVILSCAATDDELRLSVWDNGPGIPVEFHDRIFDAFTQAQPPGTRSAGGMGLGLKITRTLVEELGGRIHFEPAESGGTTFHVDLPHSDGWTDRAAEGVGAPDRPA